MAYCDVYGQCLIMQTNDYSEQKKRQEESSQSPPKSGWATGEARALMNKGAGKVRWSPFWSGTSQGRPGVMGLTASRNSACALDQCTDSPTVSSNALTKWNVTNLGCTALKMECYPPLLGSVCPCLYGSAKAIAMAVVFTDPTSLSSCGLPTGAEGHIWRNFNPLNVGYPSVLCKLPSNMVVIRVF